MSNQSSWNPPDRFDWSGLSEISGFGGAYEQNCQQMVEAGVKWAERNDAEPEIVVAEGAYGLAEGDNGDGKKLIEQMVDASDGSPTGAMVQACAFHALRIIEDGWDQYAKIMLEGSDD